MESLKIVAHYADGKIVKGTTQNFSPGQPNFHLKHMDSNGDGARPVRLTDLKAIFFVRSFKGKPGYEEKKDLKKAPPGRKVRVTFNDRETLDGTTLDYNLNATGFFLFPVDPNSNNQKIFVVHDAVSDVKFV